MIKMYVLNIFEYNQSISKLRKFTHKLPIKVETYFILISFLKVSGKKKYLINFQVYLGTQYLQLCFNTEIKK